MCHLYYYSWDALRLEGAIVLRHVKIVPHYVSSDYSRPCVRPHGTRNRLLRETWLSQNSLGLYSHRAPRSTVSHATVFSIVYPSDGCHITFPRSLPSSKHISRDNARAAGDRANLTQVNSPLFGGDGRSPQSDFEAPL
jgi:hypothetical protein